MISSSCQVLSYFSYDNVKVMGSLKDVWMLKEAFRV